MISFAEWLMPVQYTGIVQEHQAVRKNVGVFDISHMGQLIVDGNRARAWLNQMLTNNVEKLGVGQGQYTFLLNELGGIIDDLIVYRIGDEKFLLVVNASCAVEDFAWLWHRLPADHRQDTDATTIRNRSADYGGVAVQGPRVIDLFHALLGENVGLPPRNQIADLALAGRPISIARTGYTGEDGVEVFFRSSDAAHIWTLLLEKGEPFGIK